MIIRYSYNPNTPLTPEQIQRLEALKNRPVVLDEDCPEMTDEQLQQFRPLYSFGPVAEPVRKYGNS